MALCVFVPSLLSAIRPCARQRKACRADADTANAASWHGATFRQHGTAPGNGRCALFFTSVSSIACYYYYSIKQTLLNLNHRANPVSNIAAYVGVLPLDAKRTQMAQARAKAIALSTSKSLGLNAGAKPFMMAPQVDPKKAAFDKIQQRKSLFARTEK